jgi:protein-S-isoprenylcysteine O-methyltransferase Ste14
VLRIKESLPFDLGAFRFLGLVPMIAGALIYAWCALDFGRYGRGTPSPTDPPSELVVRGLYRFTRNPMYIGVSLILIGEAIVFESINLFIYSALVLIAFHLRVIYYEEPVLRKMFGQSFEKYCRTVPRWIPGINL